MTTCSQPDCSGPVKARGLCERHYRRLLRHGSPDASNPPGRKSPWLPEEREAFQIRPDIRKTLEAMFNQRRAQAGEPTIGRQPNIKHMFDQVKDLMDTTGMNYEDVWSVVESHGSVNKAHIALGLSGRTYDRAFKRFLGAVGTAIDRGDVAPSEVLDDLFRLRRALMKLDQGTGSVDA